MLQFFQFDHARHTKYRCQLEKIIDKLRETECRVQPIDSSTCLELALIQSTLVVANHILTQHACLLSEIYEHFNHLYLKYLKNLSNQTFQKQSKKILHNYLIITLKEHLICTTKHQSTGTILLRRGGDVLASPSYALKQNTHSNPPKIVQTDTTTENSIYNTLTDIIHKHITTILQEDSKSPFDISTLNIDEWIEKYDPKLWKMIVMLTRNQQERKKSEIVECIPPLRKLRCFYILCIILYTVDNRCSMPIHTLLTDIVENHGGNSELIMILNHLGAIASTDTHRRFVNFLMI